jgi:ATP adenylyltransferase
MNYTNHKIKYNRFQDDCYYNKPIIETQNFVVIVSLGMLVDGWLLIIPKQHILSFAYLRKELFEELESLHKQIIDLLKGVYKKDVIVFENGSIEENSPIGCTVDYAHMHYVPIDIDLKKELLNNKYGRGNTSFNKIKYLSDIPHFINNKPKAHYLFIEDYEGRHLSSIYYPESQLLRKIIAKHVNMEDQYDWRKFPFENKLINTFETIVKSVKNSGTQWSKWSVL